MGGSPSTHVSTSLRGGRDRLDGREGAWILPVEWEPALSTFHSRPIPMEANAVEDAEQIADLPGWEDHDEFAELEAELAKAREKRRAAPSEEEAARHRRKEEALIEDLEGARQEAAQEVQAVADRVGAPILRELAEAAERFLEAQEKAKRLAAYCHRMNRQGTSAPDPQPAYLTPPVRPHVMPEITAGRRQIERLKERAENITGSAESTG